MPKNRIFYLNLPVLRKPMKQCSWEVIRKDMQLDNRILSDILTAGKYP